MPQTQFYSSQTVHLTHFLQDLQFSVWKIPHWFLAPLLSYSFCSSFYLTGSFCYILHCFYFLYFFLLYGASCIRSAMASQLQHLISVPSSHLPYSCSPLHFAHRIFPLQVFAVCPMRWHLKHLKGGGIYLRAKKLKSEFHFYR